jgi:hypothetical protein
MKGRGIHSVEYHPRICLEGLDKMQRTSVRTVASRAQFDPGIFWIEIRSHYVSQLVPRELI